MKHTFSGQCAKPDPQQSVPAGDKDGHAFTLAQGKCTDNSKIGGASTKESAYSEHGDVSGNSSKAGGVYVETYDSGDKVFYNYQTTATLKDGVMQTGGNRYQISGGTGKMKGIKGTGSCKLKGTAEGGVEFTCTGTYTLPSAK